MPLTRRLQVLLEQAQYERLEQVAQRRGSSVATLVREAIDVTFPVGELTAPEAGARLLARPPRGLADWGELKHEIEEGLERGLPR